MDELETVKLLGPVESVRAHLRFDYLDVSNELILLLSLPLSVVSQREFHIALSEEQVRRMVRYFDSRKSDRVVIDFQE